MNDKIEKVKHHLAENRRVYIASSVSVLAGFAAAAAIGLTRVDLIQIIDAFKLQINSPTTNEITITLIRRGHPGYIVKCLETGVTYASQNHAAAQNGISPGHLSKHLSGAIPHLKGLHFERVAEAV